MTTTHVDHDDVTRLRIALARTTRWLDRNTTHGGLTRTQLSVLGSAAHRGRIGLSELAELEDVNPTMLSRIVGKLDDAGYLQRRPDPADRRVVRVQVTADGMALYRQIRAERTELLAERLATLTEEQCGDLLAAVPALEALQERFASAGAR